MASRFNAQSQREARSALFSNYNNSRQSSQSPAGPAGSRSRTPNGYGYGVGASGPTSNPAFSAYPGASGSGMNGSASSQFRSATPNSKGQYSDAVLSELESQNDDEMKGMSAKVKRLKDLTMMIGDEIRDSTALAEKMNDSFEGTSQRLKGTMNRMLRMAEKTGVGWRVWLMFFAAVILLFWHEIWAAIISWQILLVSILWRIFTNRSRPPKQSEKDEYRAWLANYRETINQRKKEKRSQDDTGSSDTKDEYQAWLANYRETMNRRKKEKRSQEDTGSSNANIHSHLLASRRARSTDHVEQGGQLSTVSSCTPGHPLTQILTSGLMSSTMEKGQESSGHSQEADRGKKRLAR